jgi:hypothetical protein
MRPAAACVLLLTVASPLARAGTISRAPVEDLGLPFWCDRGYGWDKRCYTDNTARLPAFDGTCVAPRRRAGPCLEAEYAVDAHAILSPSWTKEREVEFDPEIAAEFVVDSSAAGSTVLDVTASARSWASGALTNRGLLLKLFDDQESYGVSGPYFPSAGFAVPSLQPRLVVAYTVPTSGPSP